MTTYCGTGRRCPLLGHLLLNPLRGFDQELLVRNEYLLAEYRILAKQAAEPAAAVGSRPSRAGRDRQAACT